MTLPQPPILVITDRMRSAEPIEERALALFRGGCRWLSLREKDMAPAARLELLARLVAIGRGFGAVISVHGDIAAARHLGTGLHLASGADPVAPRLAVGGGLLGQSCHSAEELRAAAAGGVDYATLSPIFASVSKPGYGPAGDLIALAGAAPIPVLALGGITRETLPRLAGTGFAGIAVLGEAMVTPEPEAWFGRLAEVYDALGFS
jgi:thiamine-phosphate pyrophosphorylase